MNGYKLGVVAILAGMSVVTATAEPIMTPKETAALKTIAADACSEPVVFIPLSEDVDIDQRIYAVVPVAEEDPDSAHLVSAIERDWLIETGCKVQTNVLMADTNARPSALN